MLCYPIYYQERKIKTFGEIMFQIKKSGNKSTVKVTIGQSPITIRPKVDRKQGKNPRHIHIKIPKRLLKK